MHRFVSLLLPLAVLFASLSLLAAGDAPKVKRITIPGATAHYDLAYLPESRYTGDVGPRGDTQMMLDLFLPDKAAKPYPVVFTYHGGAWTTGNKEGTGFDLLIETLTKRGYAVVAFNYIMVWKDIVPQIFYDTQDGVRFLRLNAKKFNIDPTRFGVTGISAGGWLASYMGFTHGDVVMVGTQGAGMQFTEFANGGKRGAKPFEYSPHELKDRWGSDLVLVHPAWNPEPAWPDQYGVVQALSYDFSMWHSFAQNASCVPNQWAGEGHKHKNEKEILAVGLPYDYSVLSAPGWKGKGTHGPGFDQMCHSITGKGAVTLAERMLEYFERQFGPEGRAPAPEVRPYLRIFADTTTVSMLVPDPSMAIHYTTDGSTPTTASPVYKAPFSVSARTEVKAIATIADRKPSGVVTATFIPGPVPPRITGPDALPPAERGKPYQANLTHDGGPIIWRLSGEILPQKIGDLKNPNSPIVDLIGLKLDPATGVLSGTPKRGGTYWVQIQCARGNRQLATLRNYRLVIAGDQGPAIDTGDTSADTNTEIARLKSWPPAQVQALLAALTKAGCAPVAEDSDPADVMLLVPADQITKAKAMTKDYATKAKLTISTP